MRAQIYFYLEPHILRHVNDFCSYWNYSFSEKFIQNGQSKKIKWHLGQSAHAD